METNDVESATARLIQATANLEAAQNMAYGGTPEDRASLEDAALKHAEAVNNLREVRSQDQNARFNGKAAQAAAEMAEAERRRVESLPKPTHVPGSFRPAPSGVNAAQFVESQAKAKEERRVAARAEMERLAAKRAAAGRPSGAF